MKSFQVVAIWISTLSILLISNKAVGTEVQTALNLIKAQTGKFEIGAESQAIIILGNQGSGKIALSSLLELNRGPESATEIDSKRNIPIRYYADSKTPSVVPDFVLITIYYDWTPLNDRRGVEFQLMASLHLKKLSQNGKYRNKEVKFIFAIEYDQFLGVNPEIKNLAVQVIDLFPIEKYHDAIGFVVTKVPSVEQKNDEAIIADIVTRLEGLKNGLGGNTEAAPKIIKFIDILKEQNKIQIFRSPLEDSEMTASMLDSAQIKREKTAIELMIKQLQFVRTDPADFGYAANPSTKNGQETLFNGLKAELTKEDTSRR